jgi:hypothetical protein
MLAAMTHLAGLYIDDPTRHSDGCSPVHEASLCDDAQEGHGRHIESCESCSHFEDAERRILSRSNARNRAQPSVGPYLTDMLPTYLFIGRFCFCLLDLNCPFARIQAMPVTALVHRHHSFGPVP